MGVPESAVWRDASHLPDVLTAVVEGYHHGELDELSTLLAGHRIVTLGNGAAYYAGLAMQAAAWSAPSGVEVVAVPAGVLFTGGFRWREDDLPLVISTSGRLRDILALVEDGRFPRRYAMITSNPESPLAASASGITHIELPEQASDTHTCGYLANLLTAQLLYRRLSGQPLESLDAAPEEIAGSLAGALEWASDVDLPGLRAGVAFATGAGLPAALETALLLKELSGIYTEGMDAREAATTGMYALDAGFAVLGHAAPGDAVAAETLRICAGRGAATLELPGVTAGAELLAPVTTFPAALALAVGLAEERGLDLDNPAWAATYYQTAHGQSSA